MKSQYAKGHMDDGVNFYTFQGTLLHSMKREKLFLFSWRPRPKDLLSSEEKKKVVKNLRKYEREFEKEDKARKDELSRELQALRHQVAKDFLTWMHHNQALSAKKKAIRVDLRDGYDSDDERNYEFEVVTA
jgi:translation initiation factor 3 subunit B